MKKAVLFILLFSLTLTMKAQTKTDQEVLAAVEKLKSAMLSGNRSDLEHISSKNLSYGHSGGKVEDQNAFVEAIASGKSDFVTLDFDQQTIKIVDKTAIVRHQLNAKTNDGGKPGEVHLGVMLIWQKEGKTWKLLARQAYKLPVQ